jgi:stearoyl-CoA desaturase (Delta-9 desaturase)
VIALRVTIAAVTIYLHRSQARRAFGPASRRCAFFPLLAVVLTTGMLTREWGAIHRKHHAKVETPDDPHSPQTRGTPRAVSAWASIALQEAALLPSHSFDEGAEMPYNEYFRAAVT